MLEVIQSDYARLESETKATESTNQQDSRLLSFETRTCSLSDEAAPVWRHQREALAAALQRQPAWSPRQQSQSPISVADQIASICAIAIAATGANTAIAAIAASATTAITAIPEV